MDRKRGKVFGNSSKGFAFFYAFNSRMDFSLSQLYVNTKLNLC